MREDILKKMPSRHNELARQSVWWPGISLDLKDLVKECAKCCISQKPHDQPLMLSKLPSLPWQKVTTDLFEFKQRSYLLVVDYYSRFIEIALLNGTSADTVVQHTKSIFARYGIPEVVISDNGPQFSSEAYQKISNNITSSPYYPRSNGEAERAVATIKKKEDDALLAYRSTPLQNGYSPSELLMCRKLKSLILITREQLMPTIPDTTSLRIRDKKIKER